MVSRSTLVLSLWVVIIDTSGFLLLRCKVVIVGFNFRLYSYEYFMKFIADMSPALIINGNCYVPDQPPAISQNKNAREKNGPRQNFRGSQKRNRK
ncbi:Hypothetical predicted protein [Podarcis lilfordi]|uniref:Uncharacterized protein n=1 Tax=Podarcis lilfordi TaxID=74358 RepID=A0AA35P107_9SAUR|nr:Hypothetical predicted protein [Podarcis lilfordi]